MSNVKTDEIPSLNATSRLRVVHVTEAQQDTIDRALRLQHALDGNLDASTQVSDGAALAGIAAAWMEAETARIRQAKGGIS